MPEFIKDALDNTVPKKRTENTDYHPMDRLQIGARQDKDCQLQAGNGVIVINCPERHFIHNAAEFLRTGNRGIVDFGADGALSSV